jgi:hypothetical protein
LKGIGVAYDEALAMRIQQLMERRKNILARRMFGGIGFLLRGNMCVGVWKEFLIVRLDPEDCSAALGDPNVKEFDITGRPMAGWIMVKPDGAAGEQLRTWIDRSISYVRNLPAKSKMAKRTKS